MDPMDHLPEIHRLITTTNLETAPLWYLGSDGNHQNAAARAWAAGHRGPAIHFHLGASALVQRDFATAVTHFESAGRGDRYSDLFRILEVYALGLDQRCEQAEALAEKRGIRSGRSEHDQRSAALLDEVCPRQQVSGR
jgi:hypothetical protein